MGIKGKKWIEVKRVDNDLNKIWNIIKGNVLLGIITAEIEILAIVGMIAIIWYCHV